MINVRNVSKLILIILFILTLSCDSSSTQQLPELLIELTTLDFGSEMVGDISSPKQVKIYNIGKGKLKIFSIVLSGADSSDFHLMASAPLTVLPQSLTSFDVNFLPSSVGDKTAIVTVEHDAFGSPAIVTLIGKGQDPALPYCDITPSTYNFGSVVMGHSSNSVKFTISNPGNATLNVTNIDLSGSDAAEFALTVAAPLPFDVTNLKSMEFSVVFNPLNVGAKSAIVTITHNASTSPDTVQLIGTGLTNETILFEDDFTAPKSWFYVSAGSHTGTTHWNYYYPPNNTGGTGVYVSADSRISPNDVFEEAIVSPTIDCSAYTSGSIMLEFDGIYKDNPASAVGDFAMLMYVDYSTKPNPTLTQYEYYTTSWGTGQHKTYDITSIALGQSQVAIAFYYYGQNDFYFDVDNVKIYHKP